MPNKHAEHRSAAVTTGAPIDGYLNRVDVDDEEGNWTRSCVHNVGTPLTAVRVTPAALSLLGWASELDESSVLIAILD